MINGLSFLAVIGGLLAMRVQPHPHSHAPASPWEKIRSGLSYVRHHRALMGLLLSALVFSIFGISYSTLLPAFVDKVLHREALAYGTLNAFTGLGAVTGGIILAIWGNTMRRGHILALTSLAFPVALILFAINGVYALSLLLSYVLGLGFMMEFVLINTLLQVNVEDAMRGRVLSLYTLTFFGFSPFGNLAMGALGEAWGLSRALSLSAMITGVLMLTLLLVIPQVRKLI
jgi:predicted MFS family arabinose efflux permease